MCDYRVRFPLSDSSERFGQRADDDEYKRLVLSICVKLSDMPHPFADVGTEGKPYGFNLLLERQLEHITGPIRGIFLEPVAEESGADW